jgi:hypothetical protein
VRNERRQRDNDLPEKTPTLVRLFNDCGALLFLAFNRGLLSTRALGVSLLIMFLTIFAFMFVMRTSAQKFNIPCTAPSAPIDEITRKQLLSRMRMAKLEIVVLAIGLRVALTRLKELLSGFLLPLLIGLAICLYMLTKSVRTVIRTQKLLIRPAA